VIFIIIPSDLIGACRRRRNEATIACKAPDILLQGKLLVFAPPVNIPMNGIPTK
jgi:hypothetical protein